MAMPFESNSTPFALGQNDMYPSIVGFKFATVVGAPAAFGSWPLRAASSGTTLKLLTARLWRNPS